MRVSWDSVQYFVPGTEYLYFVRPIRRAADVTRQLQQCARLAVQGTGIGYEVPVLPGMRWYSNESLGARGHSSGD